MRVWAVLMLVSSALLVAARLFTGIDYREDSALAYFVLKPTPDLVTERTRVDDADFQRVRVLDDDELDLAYGDLYRGAMAVAPGIAMVLVGSAVLLLRRGAAR